MEGLMEEGVWGCMIRLVAVGLGEVVVTLAVFLFNQDTYEYYGVIVLVNISYYCF